MLATLVARRRLPASAGCTRSSSTAIGSRRGSRPAGSAADPQRARLDGEVRRATLPRRFAALPVGNALIDGELVVENADRRLGLLAAAGRPRAKAAPTASSTMPSICCISTATICATRRWSTARQLLEQLLGNGARPAPLQRAFRAETASSSCATPAGLSLEGVVSKLRDGPPIAPAAARAGSSRNARQRQEFVIAGYVPSTDRAQGDRLAGRSASTRARRCAMPAASAPASPRRVAEALYRRARSDAHRRRARSPNASAPTRRGRSATSSRSWWPRSSSAPGRRTASCAMPPSGACARTSRRREIVRETAMARTAAPEHAPKTAASS